MYKFRLTYDEWKSMTKKQRKGGYFHTDDFKGYIGLLTAEEVTDRQVWQYETKPVTVLDQGYHWLSILPEDAYYCITVMMDEQYKIRVTYIDMIDGQGVDADGVPYCHDCYLDLVIYPDGKVHIEDRDELEEALAGDDISKEQYERALATADMLQNGLLRDYSDFEAFVREKLALLTDGQPDGLMG